MQRVYPEGPGVVLKWWLCLWGTHREQQWCTGGVAGHRCCLPPLSCEEWTVTSVAVTLSLFSAVRPCSAPWAQPRHVEPPVCAFHQGERPGLVLPTGSLGVWALTSFPSPAGWSDGAQCYTPLQEEIRDHFAVQANMSITVICDQLFWASAVSEKNALLNQMYFCSVL